MFLLLFVEMLNFFLLQPHLKKCFSNVRKLGIIQGPAGGLQVHDMVSAEEECVVLQK